MWQPKPGLEHHHLCGRTHVHHIPLFDDVTGAEHNIHIILGVPHCPTCGRPYEMHGEMPDPKAAVESAIADLEGRLAKLLDYAIRHNLPIKTGPLHTRVSEGHRSFAHQNHTFLLAHRQLK